MIKLAEIYFQEIVRLHGEHIFVVSDRDSSRFTLVFGKSFLKVMGTQLKFSMALHPNNDRQTKRINQTLEGMLWACIFDFQGSCRKYLTLVEFTYNNSYQVMIQMALYEALQDESVFLLWYEVGERKFFVQDLDERNSTSIEKIEDCIKTAQSRQKGFSNIRCWLL